MKTNIKILTLLFLIYNIKGACNYYHYIQKCESTDGEKTCILINNECIEKDLCDRATITEKEQCEEAITTNPLERACIFDEEQSLCITKEICETNLTYDECTQSSLKPDTVMCYYTGYNCIPKFICNENLPKEDCNEDALTSNNNVYTCYFNEIENKCETRQICFEYLEEEECNEAITSDPLTTKCRYDTKNKNCTVVNLCDAITITDKTECSKALTMDSNSVCFYNERKKICEARKLCDKTTITNKKECNEGLTSDPENKKCYYDDNEKQCKIATLCSSELNEEECNNAVTSDPSITKCYFDKTCQVRELCDFILFPKNNDECESQETLIPDKTKCVFNKAKSKCETKTLCDQVAVPSRENCESATTLNSLNSICIYDSGKCIESEITFEILCLEESHPSVTNCESIINLEESYKKCVYNLEDHKCEIKDLCLLIDSSLASKFTCESATTSKMGLKCMYDFEKKICLEQSLCLDVEKPNITNCGNATTGDLRSRCIYDDINKVCKIENKTCEDVKLEASKELCESIYYSSGDYGCIYDEELKQCKLARRCLRVQQQNEETCKISPTDDNIRKKCVYFEEYGICRQELKFCNEIIYGATEEICENARISDKKNKCVLNITNAENYFCEEVISPDNGDSTKITKVDNSVTGIKVSFLFTILSLLM